MFDLIIQGGKVVRPEGVVISDIAVAGEPVVALAAPGTLEAETVKGVVDGNDISSCRVASIRTCICIM